MKIPSKVYDILKEIAQVVLPALGTLYFALSQIWGLPFGEQIVGTITAIDMFLGACLHISNKNYTGDGTLNIDTTNPTVDRYSLDLDTALNDIQTKDRIVLKVSKK